MKSSKNKIIYITIMIIILIPALYFALSGIIQILPLWVNAIFVGIAISAIIISLNSFLDRKNSSLAKKSSSETKNEPETKTSTLKMAKADSEDIYTLTKFFNLLEIIDKWSIEEIKEDEKTFRDLGPYIINYGAIDTNKFLEDWIPRIDHRWRRIIIGYPMLIENYCDPDKDYLAPKPE